jgi:phosphatidylglycerol:prolipoprotein diacylglycerol transferase
VPKSIRIFDYDITIYGILLALSMILAVIFVVSDAKRKNENQDFYLGAACMAVPGAVIGGRLFYVGFSWSLYKSDLISILNLKSGGMAFYGALLGGVIFVAIFCAIRKASLGEVTDTLTFAVLIMQIITRWGDFFNRESFGEYTDWASAMQLPLTSVRSSEVSSLMRENLLTIDGANWIQVHPVFFYESIWCLILFLILLVRRNHKRFSGEIFLRYLAGYGFGRFFFEWLRTDQLWIPQTTIPVSMVISAVLFVFCSISVIVSRSMAKKRSIARQRRKQELEEQKAAAKAMEEEGPVDIEEILREEARLQEEDARREAEELRKAKGEAPEEASSEPEAAEDEAEAQPESEEASDIEETPETKESDESDETDESIASEESEQSEDESFMESEAEDELSEADFEETSVDSEADPQIGEAPAHETNGSAGDHDASFVDEEYIPSGDAEPDADGYEELDAEFADLMEAEDDGTASDDAKEHKKLENEMESPEIPEEKDPVE